MFVQSFYIVQIPGSSAMPFSDPYITVGFLKDLGLRAGMAMNPCSMLSEPILS